MALGAITVQRQGVIGNLKYAVIDIVGDSSYPTGGSALDLFAVGGFTFIYFVDVNIILPQPVVTAATITYDQTNKKLQSFGTAAGATGATETTATTVMSAQKYRLFILGQ